MTEAIRTCENCKHWKKRPIDYPIGDCYQHWMQVTTAPEQTGCKKKWELKKCLK